MDAFKFGSWMKKVANDPMAAINAQRVAQMQAMANQVRNASGTPNPTGNGTHRWSGVVRGGNVSNAQYTPPSPPPVQAKSPAVQPQPQFPRGPAPRPASPFPSTPKTTTTPVNGQALAQQMQQQQQSAAPASAAPPASNSWPHAWANQTNPHVPPPPAVPQGPTLFQRMSNAYNAFKGTTPGATAAPAAPAPQAQPSHIITTDNGRQFDTIKKQFLDGRPGGFAR